MKPIPFNGHNIVMGKDQPQYTPLPAFKNASYEGEVVQCWELTDRELEEIAKTGKVWVLQKTFNEPLQPITVSVEPLITTCIDEFNQTTGRNYPFDVQDVTGEEE